jgi:hypothetical protein
VCIVTYTGPNERFIGRLLEKSVSYRLVKKLENHSIVSSVHCIYEIYVLSFSSMKMIFYVTCQVRLHDGYQILDVRYGMSMRCASPSAVLCYGSQALLLGNLSVERSRCDNLTVKVINYSSEKTPVTHMYRYVAYLLTWGTLQNGIKVQGTELGSRL